MNPIRHPRDYSSNKEYIKEISKLRYSLTETLISAYREGQCTKQLSQLLRYLKIMLFSCQEKVKYTPEKTIKEVPLTGNISLRITEMPEPDTLNYGTLSIQLLDDTSLGDISIRIQEFPIS